MLPSARLALLAPLLVVLACSFDDSPAEGTTGEAEVLFDDDGTYVVQAYDRQDGSGFRDVAESRRDAYMIRFHGLERVAEAVACQEGTAEMESSITASLCHKDAASVYACSCFSFATESEKLFLLPFDEGSAAPDIYQADSSSITEVAVAKIEDKAADYTFTGLPPGLFGLGEGDAVLVRQKADNVWDAPNLTPPDAPPNCDCL